MTRERVILHVDMNAFFASVEALSHPEVKGKPMAVAGEPENRRGIILAKNELAKKAGVQTAETIWSAQKKCPGLILLPPHHELYAEYCDKANEIYERYTDLVEKVGIDESYLDVTGSQQLFGSGKEIADSIRETIQKELALTVSVGVSFCKIFAKMGSDLRKPNYTNVIDRAHYQEILYPLPVTDLMYVGKATAQKLLGIGVRRIGDLAALGRESLVQRLGKHGVLLYDYVHGLDAEPVCRTEDLAQVKSIGNSLTFRRDLVSAADISLGLGTLCESVAYRLRRQGKKCYGVQISIKTPEFKTIDRQMQLERPTQLTKPLLEAANALLTRSWKIGEPIRLLSVTAIQLTDETDGGQMSLFESPADDAKQEALERAVDRLKEAYGSAVVRPAAKLKNDLGIE